MRFPISGDHPIRAQRKRAKQTLASLGAASKIHPSHLWALEHGLIARDDELQRLAGVLGCDPADLVGAR